MLKRLEAILKLLTTIKKQVGKTFIQKGIYILQEGLQENLGYKFKIYIYGPYSEDLASDIDSLEYMKLIRVNYDPDGYGYIIETTPKAKKFLGRIGNSISIDKINRIIDLLEGESVKKMELLGTLLYFSKLTTKEEEIRMLATKVKPHFSQEQITEGINLLRKESLIK